MKDSDIKYRQGRSKEKMKESYKFTFLSILGFTICLLAIAISTHCVNAQEKTDILDLFETPDNYERRNYDSFSLWLYSLPIHTNEAKYYNGEIVPGNGTRYAAVFDYNIGEKDLHHCADAVFWLRSYYLFSHNRENEIGFHYTDGTFVSYFDWLAGNNINVSTEDTFWAYMEHMWIYAGTYSLDNLETKRIPMSEMQPGDIFVKGGFPGHAITVVDVAINDETGHKVFMLAQSYMPAQEQHILIDPSDGDVWFSMNEDKPIRTYQWTFKSNNLKRFIW